MDSAFIETLREGREGGTSLPGCRLILSDGSTYFILLADSDAFDCHSGMPVDPLFREELRRAHTRREICAKALDLTARRDHARQELKLKLEKRFIYSGGGDSGEVRILIDQVLLLLQQRGFLDDRRYAGAWAASRLRRHPEGPPVLAAGLRNRGVAGELVNQLVGQLLEDGAFDDALDRAARKLGANRRNDKEKLIRKLQTRGFSYRDIINRLEASPELWSGPEPN